MLVGGFLRATSTITLQREQATLLLTLIERLSEEDTAALDDEGARLRAFTAADTQAHDFRFVAAE